MASSSYNLKAKSFASTLVKKLKDSLTKEKFCDATIICQGKHFQVHRLLLCSCSEYFENIFNNTPCKHPFIVLKDVRSTTFELILQFIYLGKVTIPEDEIAQFIEIAESLEISLLSSKDEVSQANEPVISDSTKETQNSQTKLHCLFDVEESSCNVEDNQIDTSTLKLPLTEKQNIVNDSEVLKSTPEKCRIRVRTDISMQTENGESIVSDGLCSLNDSDINICTTPGNKLFQEERLNREETSKRASHRSYSHLKKIDCHPAELVKSDCLINLNVPKVNEPFQGPCLFKNFLSFSPKSKKLLNKKKTHSKEVGVKQTESANQINEMKTLEPKKNSSAVSIDNKSTNQQNVTLGQDISKRCPLVVAKKLILLGNKNSKPHEIRLQNFKKKKVNAYSLYAIDVRDKIRSKNPSASQLHLNSLVHWEWKHLNSKYKTLYEERALYLNAKREN